MGESSSPFATVLTSLLAIVEDEYRNYSNLVRTEKNYFDDCALC